MVSLSWSQLPSEIQQDIFQRLDSEDLIQLQTTCKSWHPAACECFYNDIRLSARGGEREKLLKRTLQAPGNLSRLLIKRLYIKPEVEQLGRINEFNTLLVFGALCPNLTTIFVVGPPTREYYETLLALRQLGHLKKLNCIDTPSLSTSEDYTAEISTSDMEDYCTNADADDVTNSDSIAASFPMAQHLKEFPQLEHLDIQLCNNVDLHRIDDLLEICPGSLKKISVLFRTIFEETPSVKQFDPKSSTRLHNIKLFELENNGPLNDEDLIYMMHRFPALQKISIYREEENCSTPTAKLGPQSADVICKFLQYLGNIPEVMLHDLKVAPDVMCTVIIKLSKYWRVNELETCGLPEWRDDSFAYFLADKKPNPSTSFAIKLELPSFGINPLYHVALKALSGQLTKLGVRGTLDEDQLLLEDHSVTEMAKSDIYNESLGRILDSTTRIKDIQLQALLINKLPASMATSVEKMQLNSLEINNCVFFPQMLNQLSQRLSFVKRFTFNNIATVSGNPSSGDCKQETNIHMPYTAFDKICANYTGFVILLTLSTDTMTRYYACTGPELLEQVSKEEYSQMKNTTDGVPSINIICRDCNAITVFGGMGFGGNEVVLH